jgi:hypothetical protein
MHRLRSAAVASVALLALLRLPRATLAVKPFTHTWDTPSEMMAMHGKYKSTPLDKDIRFIAEHYGGMITTGTGCPSQPAGDTIEESVLGVATRIKAVKPTATVGMYWRTDFAMELAQCSGFASEWKAHPEYRLKNDTGGLIGETNHYYFDWLNPAAAKFFGNVLLNATVATLPSGKPVLDYIYCDGAGAWSYSNPRPFAAGVGLARSQKLMAAKHAMFADVQRQMDARGLGQSLILNGMDTEETATQFVATGAAGAMFDHWSILQFLDRSNGEFNATMVDEGFQLVDSKLLSNFTTQIKGWVGPVVKQRGQYPPNYTPINTTAAMVREASERFSSELAMFLLVATEHDFWIYSWFWGWYDYVGGNESSTIPPDFYPQAKCALGAPVGPMERVAGTWTYKRQFAHASVFVDLTNRTASKVDFIGCDAPTPPLPAPPGSSPAPSPATHGNCPSASGDSCAECVATIDERCPGVWCHQPCIFMSKKDAHGDNCQPASWWAQHGKKTGATCAGNATGCSPTCKAQQQ